MEIGESVNSSTQGELDTFPSLPSDCIKLVGFVAGDVHILPVLRTPTTFSADLT